MRSRMQRAVFSWSQTAKANRKERKEKGRKILKHVAKLIAQTVEQGPRSLADSGRLGIGALGQAQAEVF